MKNQLQQKQISKKTIAYDYIRKNILDGTFTPGYRLVIDKIKKELKISSIPVREAIQQLQAENLIDIVPYSGAVVKMIDEKGYEELQAISALLEGYADRQAANYISSKDIKKLEEINKKMREALNNLAFEDMGKLDHEFHLYILHKCHNEHVISTLKSIWESIAQVRNVIFTIIPWRAKDSISEHAKLLALFKEKASPDVIEHFGRQHKLNVLFSLKNKQGLKNFVK